MDSKGKCINFYSATPGSNNVAVTDDEIEVKARSPDEAYDVRKGGAVLAEIEVWPTLAIGDSTYGYKKPPAISALRFSTRKWMI